jgi:hypothetical protein
MPMDAVTAAAWIASRRSGRQMQPVPPVAPTLDHPHLARHVL